MLPIKEKRLNRLPPSRLAALLRAFARAAVDFVGQFMTMQGRGRPRQKRTTNRRGVPDEMLSDN